MDDYVSLARMSQHSVAALALKFGYDADFLTLLNVPDLLVIVLRGIERDRTIIHYGFKPMERFLVIVDLKTVLVVSSYATKPPLVGHKHHYFRSEENREI